MTLPSEQRRRVLAARPRRLALLCGLVVTGLLATAAPAAAGPLLVSAPSLDRAGRTLSTDAGGWFPASNTYTFGWQRCDAAVAVCTSVPGRTGTTYLLTTADIGRRIRSVVVADNNVLGPSSAASSATAVIAASPPLNLTPPSLTGSGSTLTSTQGTWSDPSPESVTYTRQWQRCSGGGGLTCQNVAGRTGATYALTSADDGRFIRVVASAEGLGRSSVASAPLGPIQPLPAPGGGEGRGGGRRGGGQTGGGGGGGNKPAAGPRKLRPFPKVIIAGRLARGLTFISGLSIRRGPRGATVSVTCRGRGCPRGGRFRGRLNRAGNLRLRRFQRIYGPGAVIEIRITKRGAIGKFIRLRARARSIPSRRDSCLVPGASRPRRCP